MTRDRYRDLKEAQGDEDDSEFQDMVLNMEPREGFMDDFFAEVEALHVMVQKLQDDISRCKRLHSDIQSAPMTTEDMKNRLEDFMDSIKKAAKQINQRLKAIGQSIEQMEQSTDETQADVRIRKTQHSALTKKFVELMRDYSGAQVEHQERMKNKFIRVCDNYGISMSEDDLDAMMKQGCVGGLAQGIRMDTEQGRQTLADIESRHADIIQLESSIVELHDMFVDMATLLESQGEMIDVIEKQVGKAVEGVGDGTKDMRMAYEYEKNARKKKLMIVACMAIAGAIGITVIAGWLGF